MNAGLRYDLVTGFLIDQSKIPNYVALTAAAAAGRFNGVPGFDEFGKKAQEDKNNIQPRIGARLRPPRRRQGRRPRRLGHLLRLRLHQRQHPVPGPERAGRIGRRVQREQHRRHQEPGRQLLHVGQPVTNIASAERGEPERAVLQLERRGAADPAAVDEPDLGRLVARADAARR